MVFSSVTFLFAFLPVVLILVTVCGKSSQNLTLLICSLFFYAWGETVYVFLMIGSICLNYSCGLLINLAQSHQRERLASYTLAIGIVINLLLLCYYKYADFLFQSLLSISPIAIVQSDSFSNVHLPLGISFFTFQAMSYLIDVYRKETPAQTNFINSALYISLFPQLIAGPIVRYKDIANQITERRTSFKLFHSGVQRFTFGLAKKCLIANPLGEIADQIFAVDQGLTTPVAWLGLFCYTLQIYFDFSGYSDMAIGLGRMFGFRFLENFNYPYIAKSLQDFLLRLHISLSSWFRDYLYIPLGGNRVGPVRTYLNLVVVFLLCGLWHGASWNFVIWGAIHGFFLALERIGMAELLQRSPKVVQHAYTLLVVMLAWVFFRAETLPEALEYMLTLLSVQSGDSDMVYIEQYLNSYVLVVLIFGCLLSTPFAKQLNVAFFKSTYGNFRSAVLYSLASNVVLVALLLFSVLSISAGAYNPFIYFRF